MRRPWVRRIVVSTIIAVAVVATLWLARAPDVADVPSPKRAPVAGQQEWSPLRGGAQDPTAEGGDSARTAPMPPVSGEPLKAATAEVRLTFQPSTSSARVGEAIDLQVAVDARVPVDRIAVEVEYDPALLKARGGEEIDYTHRPPEEQMFAVRSVGDGRASLLLTFMESARPTLRAGVVQFEGLAPGSAKFKVSRIDVTDRAGGSVSWTASGQEGQIAID